MKVLLICFANTCRSPVAEVLLSQMLSAETNFEISSRGMAGGPGDTPESMQRALQTAGLQLLGERGQPLTKQEARGADLLLFMERRLLRDGVVTDPSLWPKSFTLREFARRGLNNPPQLDTESFEQWRALLHSTRSREELLGTDTIDDVEDPGLSGSEEDFNEMIRTLTRDVANVAALLRGWSATSA
jgi:protein-tyrosine phosphatase